MLDDNYSLELCENLSRWRYEDLPQNVIHTLKGFILDTLGVIAGASNAPGIGELNQRLARWEKTGSATGLVGMRRYSPPTAAMANGAAAHALDFDDQHDPARVHTNCVVLPALLATAEDIGTVSGKDFLVGYAIGAEVHARLGLACNSSIGHGWHPTMVFGTLAASLGAARLLNLDAEGMRNALGMAYHQTSGSAQSMRDGVLSKRLGPGFSARNAVLGAFLAADGLTGTRRPLEGNAGLFDLYERGKVDAPILDGALGEKWNIVDYSFKPYPCCRCNHTVIGIALELRTQGLTPEKIKSVSIGMGNVNWTAVGLPYDVTRDSVVHAQFNAAYSFARALADGRIDLRSYQRPAIGDTRVSSLAEKTQVLDDTSIDAAALEPAWVKVTTTDGRVIEKRRDTVKGSPQEPMTEQELLEKLYDCLESGVGASRADADRLANAVMSIDSAPDAAAALLRVFPQPAAQQGRAA